MTRSEISIRYSELKLDNIIETLRRRIYGPTEEDPLAGYADPEPPRDVKLDPVKRHNWARRLRG